MSEKQRVKPLTCPKCRRRQYFVCSNRKCQCWRVIPKGKQPQRPVGKTDALQCPYCCFAAHIDYWFDRDMQRFLKDGSRPDRASGREP